MPVLSVHLGGAVSGETRVWFGETLLSMTAVSRLTIDDER